MNESYGAIEDAAGSHGRVLGSTSNPQQSKTSSPPQIEVEADDSSSVNSEMIENLTRNQENQPLLSPDDPRVTPLNVTKVKILRGCLHLLLVFNVIWLVLSLISYFVSIPGFDSRGKSFFEFSFILISLYANFLSYVFFLTPSDLKIDYLFNIAGLILISLDLFMILVVPYQRSQHGKSEYIASFFSLFSIGLNLVSNQHVLIAKRGEEVRLTGRIETRKTLKEHLSIGLEFFLKVLLILYIASISLNIYLKCIDSAVSKPWGTLVFADDETYRIHLYCQGDVYGDKEDSNDQPIVLLESGHDSSEEFVSWLQELYQLNKVHRYCIYDRPGYGFSDSSPSPYSLGINSDLLSSVLMKQNITGPFLVVGQGIGGLYARVFATRHIHEVHSLLLVDGWSEELLLPNPLKHSKSKDAILPREIPKLNRRYGLKLWLKGVFSSANMMNFYNLIFHQFRSSERIFGRDMHLQGKYLRARLQEQISASILSYNDILISKDALDDADKQVSVISSKFLIKQSLTWGNWQRELTKLSHNSHNEWVLTDSGYEVWKYVEGRKRLQKLLLRMLGENDDL
ncbi:hypothetical protein DASC09_050880 [Saccharomycopsis crataegensis]|uniref:AB hydrolase-1 domain-containing protein n=1 Tax=Saccharomycopsis crataegensis TaxID=43959 RepID=A0AAV5QSG4_9ASCO|nr:hypothetical protein DASC09_050880 [Saccharomycopsis crataegensis]